MIKYQCIECQYIKYQYISRIWTKYGFIMVTDVAS